MIRYNNVIFDLDGVICSTDKFHYLAWKRAVEPLGVEFNEGINNRLRGVSRMESLNIILERYDGRLPEEEKVKLCEYKNNLYREMLSTMSMKDLSKDVLDTLVGLKGCGKKIAIGSSSKNTKLILEKLGIIDLFDAIADGNDIVRSKPDPEVFLKAAQMLGEGPSDCAVVEDAESGIQAAAAGGFYAIAISDARKSPLADLKINKLSDLLTL
ncbi:MAG: beta-phosphoglucomutase [Candidatus Coproplasma sp.]